VRKIYNKQGHAVNRRNLPLNALRACEAAARHLSFSKAADELCVTHAAVSHQIKLLEEQLGVTLFRRSNRGVRLTEAGETLVPVLGEAFDRIGGALDGLVAKPRDRALRVTLTPLFASRWLMPRLGRLRAAHPGLEVGLLPSLRLVDLVAGEADLGVRCGIPPWSGLVADFLLPVTLTPLCSPAVLDGEPPLKTPVDLLRQTLIHADVGDGRQGEEWRLWFAAAGLPDAASTRGLSFHDPGLALQAAADGLGVAMGYAELTLPEVGAGHLVRPFDIAARHPFSYYLVHAEARRDEAEIAAFRQWILEEATTGGGGEN
jgi:LysR family glycine cleavage system transcriptional activator